MEKKPYNKIDDLFKNAFEQEGNASNSDNWNVPSDEVWEKLLTDTEKEKKRRPVLLYWKWGAVAAGIALFVLAAQSIQYRNQLQQQAEKIEFIEQQLQHQQANDSSFNLDKDNSELVAIDNESGSDNLVKETSATFRKETILESSKEYLTDENITNSKTSIIIAKDTIAQVTPFVINDQISENTSTTPELLSTLHTPIPLLKNDIPTPILSKKITPFKVSSKSYLSVSYSFADSPQKFDHRRNPIFDSKVSEEKTINLALRFAYPIKDNWFIESGLQYAESTAQREHRSSTRFRRGNERLNNRGALESTYNLSLSSSEYALETDVVLSRSTGSSSTITDGRDLDLTVITSNGLQQISIPILLVHQLNYRRLSLAMKAGVSANFRLKDEVVLESVKIEEDFFTVENFSSPRTQPFQQNKTIEWDYHVSAALAYQFNSQWSLQIEPYFSRSIASKSIFLRRPIYAHSAGVQVGIKYIL